LEEVLVDADVTGGVGTREARQRVRRCREERLSRSLVGPEVTAIGREVDSQRLAVRTEVDGAMLDERGGQREARCRLRAARRDHGSDDDDDEERENERHTVGARERREIAHRILSATRGRCGDVAGSGLRIARTSTAMHAATSTT